MLAVLTPYLFISFSSNIFLSLIFFSFLFLVSISWFLSFQYYRASPIVVIVPVHGKGLFYSACHDQIYYFSLQSPLSGLGVPVDHH